MSHPAHRIISADEAIRLHPLDRKGNLVRLMPPASDQPALRAWALSVADAADRRLGELEARVAQLENLVVTDELTGALNRRGFLMEFSRAIDAARRGGPRGVVIICDLDGFKLVNDRLGHVFGDEVLRQVGSLFRHGVRKMDAAARLGGDEFALLLIGADLDTAQRRSAGFARSIAALAPHTGGPSLPLSASFGVAAFDGSEDKSAVLHRADLSMYGEKRQHAAAERRRTEAKRAGIAGTISGANGRALAAP